MSSTSRSCEVRKRLKKDPSRGSGGPCIYTRPRARDRSVCSRICQIALAMLSPRNTVCSALRLLNTLCHCERRAYAMQWSFLAHLTLLERHKV